MYKGRHTNHSANRKRKIWVFATLAIIACTAAAIGNFYGTDMLSKKAVTANATVDKAAEEQNAVDEKAEALKAEKAELSSLIDGFSDHIKSVCPEATVSIGIKNLDTGAYAENNNKQMNSASVIKLFIMETVYKQAEKGEYTLTDDVIDDLTEMITKSSNKAANRFIDDFGGVDASQKDKIVGNNIIEQTINNSGYKLTNIDRKMHDVMPPGGPSGYQNWTCAEDVITLLDKLYKKELFSGEHNEMALNMLKNQERRGKIPAKIAAKHPNVTVANKTGELAQVENDVAIIMGDTFNLAFAVFVNDIPYKSDGTADYDKKEEVQHAISDIGLELVENFLNK